jgi:ferredoxin
VNVMEPSRPRIDGAICDGCGLCVQACPAGGLSLREGVAEIAEDADCSFCGECEVACIAGAIVRVFRIEFAAGAAAPEPKASSVREG